MITLPRGEDDKLWEKYWSETKDEWFKIEVLQDYSGEDESASLSAWLRGDADKSIELLIAGANNQEWIKDFRTAPFRKTRIHIVEKPLTPYLLWEIEHYKNINIPLAKETVYLIDKAKTLDLDIPDGDFIIFDQTRIARNHYDENGRELAMDFYDETDNIAGFLHLRAELLARARLLKA